MSEDSDSISEEERSLFRPFTRESLAAIEARIAEELAKQKELEKKRAEGEVWARIRRTIAYFYDFSSRAVWLRRAHTIYHTRTSQDVPRAASNKYRRRRIRILAFRLFVEILRVFPRENFQRTWRGHVSRLNAFLVTQVTSVTSWNSRGRARGSSSFASWAKLVTHRRRR